MILEGNSILPEGVTIRGLRQAARLGLVLALLAVVMVEVVAACDELSRIA